MGTSFHHRNRIIKKLYIFFVLVHQASGFTLFFLWFYLVIENIWSSDSSLSKPWMHLLQPAVTSVKRLAFLVWIQSLRGVCWSLLEKLRYEINDLCNSFSFRFIWYLVFYQVLEPWKNFLLFFPLFMFLPFLVVDFWEVSRWILCNWCTWL